MPELPEVTVTLQGIQSVLEGRPITACVIRQRSLRWPIPDGIETKLIGHIVNRCERRGKYMLLHFSHGCLVWHLGMSGRISVYDHPAPSLIKHDHIDLETQDKVIRFNDTRRFSAFLWTEKPQEFHLLSKLGAEPLDASWHADYLRQKAQKSKQAIKPFIMDQSVVVGIGNIYACETLFESNINPTMPAHHLTHRQAVDIVQHSRKILQQAITQGGTSLKDFLQTDGRSGYFKVSLKVYGRTDAPCIVCQTPIACIRLGQRASFFCPSCQK